MLEHYLMSFDIYGYAFDGAALMTKDKVTSTMREFKHGKLRSGSKTGPKVKSRKQAVAIALKQARKK